MFPSDPMVWTIRSDRLQAVFCQRPKRHTKADLRLIRLSVSGLPDALAPALRAR